MSYLSKQDRRKTIIEATLRQVGKVGFGGLTTRGIAHELDAAPGTIHHNFSSLTELKCAALQHMADESFKEISALMDEYPPKEALLRALVFSTGDEESAAASRNWISAADEATRSEEVAQVHGSILSEFHSLLKTYIDAYIRSNNTQLTISPDLLAWKLMALATSLSDFQLSEQISLYPDQARDIIRDELHRSLFC